MNDQEYHAARRVVLRRWFKRAFFAVHLVVYVMVAPSNGGYGTGYWALWLPVLIAHYLYTFNIIQHWLDRATQRELERRQGSSSEKAKRGPTAVMRLTDDGEIETVDGEISSAGKMKVKR